MSSKYSASGKERLRGRNMYSLIKWKNHLRKEMKQIENERARTGQRFLHRGRMIADRKELAKTLKALNRLSKT